MTAIHTDNKKIKAILDSVTKPGDATRGLQLAEKLQKMEELAKLKAIPSYEHILPLCLTLNGKPYTMKNHFPFSPVFRLLQPDKMQLKAARQVSKSQSMATTSVMLGAATPHYKILHVTPLYEQIRRFSSNYVRPLIDSSPIRPIWVDSSTSSSVLQRSFRNNSIMFFSFASNNSDRIRGLSVNRNCIDELQDFDIDDLPIIGETMSASVDFDPSALYGGTPKTLDNAVEATWRETSQAEWFIKCYSCNYTNICSTEFDLEKMIGPYHDFISEKHPGIVCAKCQKPVHPREHGRWVHRYPDKRWSFAGYHVPQVILPMHYASASKWGYLLAKQRGAGNMTRAQFHNEVLGESADFGQKLITETELRKAANLPWKRTVEPSQQLVTKSKEYSLRVMAVDWGGGGESGTSFTSIAVLGWLPTGEIHVIWGKRFLLSQNHVEEAKSIMRYMRAFRCQYVAHDYTGAGTIRETVMVNAGIRDDSIIPITYIGAASGQLMRYKPPSDIHPRKYWQLDKTRSLLTTCNAIRFGKVRFFQYDHVGSDSNGLIRDFLALIENKLDSRSGSDVYTITRNPAMTDDFAQAVNIGCCAIWHNQSAWPDFSKLVVIPEMNLDQLRNFGDPDQAWANDPEWDRQ